MASGYVFYAFAKLKWAYRCPKCGVRATRVPEAEAGSAIHYRCRKCRTDWDTGWHEVEGGD
jgi:predicted SprT family Zn-dependent metalloprotease